MAYIVLGLNFGTDSQPDQISVGTTSQVSDIEIAINFPGAANVNAAMTRRDVWEYVHRLLDLVVDGRFTSMGV